MTAVAGPSITIESSAGDVGIWSLGADRFRVGSPSGEQTVDGYTEAQRVVHWLAAAR